MLTKRQATLATFICNYLAERGVTPSYEEMCAALGLRSKSGIHALVLALEERGYIRRIPNRARAIDVLRLPTGVALTQLPVVAAASSALVEVPIMGCISTGAPRATIEAKRGVLRLGADVMPSGGCFALEVKGDSMREAAILDGDLAIVRRQDVAASGDIVVVLIDEQEAALKRLRRYPQTVVLQAANPAYEARVLKPDRVKIIGRLALLLRHCPEGSRSV